MNIFKNLQRKSVFDPSLDDVWRLDSRTGNVLSSPALRSALSVNIP